MALGLPALEGSSSPGTWLSLKLVPPLRLLGWGVVEGELWPGGPLGRVAPRPVAWVRGSPPVLSSRPAPCEGGLVFPLGHGGALGPICTSVLAKAGELAQQLPPLIPHPHSKYLGIKRQAEWTF